VGWGGVQLREALHRPPISVFLNKYILRRIYVQGTNYWTDRLVIKDDVNGLKCPGIKLAKIILILYTEKMSCILRHKTFLLIFILG
jgi:hypothetical protein